MARTPKGKKPAGAGRADGGRKLRRKAALQGKRIKKTLMALGGEDTKEEVMDLLNQSDISIIGSKAVVHPPVENPAPAADEEKVAVKDKLAEKATAKIKKSLSVASLKTKAASKEVANGISNGIANGISKTKSLKNLRAGQLKLENVPEVSVEAEKEKEKPMENGENHAPATNGQEAKQSIQEMTLSKLPTLAGVKSMFTNTVWGVPYAKVMEQDLGGMDISVCDEPEKAEKAAEEPSKCRIS